ncbi:hypothetical protein QYF50_15485 [Paenibacillus vini]|uniref:hypothetical protein n=1 Tax=Paenibacillus vini TaxID=1476024 RepID=UPI0025B68D26|nr:hypothetical protein [Paenibacillus vini]MDN4069254.1 hypothetical protein [Paenibacillus vini]MDN4069307.1 hypothetical protein [Paenibacillus vini]
MVNVTDELWRKMQEFEKRFPDSCVPLEMVPGSETTEGLIDKINKSLAAGEDLLPAEYGWKFDGSEIY